MHFRWELQIAEALGPVNRWFCSQTYGREVSNPDLLMKYYVKNGGADDFSDRWAEAMDAPNRWYCSEFYGREICDPQTLWDYYVEHAPARAAENAAGGELANVSAATC
jgi:hypothetical protein